MLLAVLAAVPVFLQTGASVKKLEAEETVMNNIENDMAKLQSRN
jgi:hypothetical protein